MNFKQKLLSCSSSFLLGGIFLPITVSAQGVTSDGTLSTKVTSPDNRNFTITNGNQPNNGANLFHSFSNFSLPTGGSATFDLVNTPNISTIFSRVTGGNVSNIDGLIQTTNNSNPVSLFLLNPSGIIFGPNARLNIGGSFIGTTASRIEFVNGTEFSAVDPSSGAPLLRVSAPIGLIFGQPAAAIAVRGAGHRITSGSLSQADRSNNPASGNGGDIKINMQQLLLMRHTSLISATAEGIGNGGNLLIQAPIIVGLENSDIIANAVQGAGGNIAIATQGLFGFKSRPQLTLESDITASSQFGLSGSVNISNLAFTPTTGLIQLPSSIDDPSQKIAQGCRTYDNSRFVATGRGGLPDDPSDRRSSNQPWTDLRDPSTFRKIPNSTAVSQAKSNTPPIVEAIGWRINAKGTVDIYAANNAEIERSVTNCAGLSTISTKFSKGGNIQ